MDVKIIQSVIDGNTEEFNILIEKYYNELFVFVHNQVNDIETTKDLLQEIFMRVFDKLHTYNSEKASFRTWLYRVSGNYCRNFHKKKKTSRLEDYHVSHLRSDTDLVEDLVCRDDVSMIIEVMKRKLKKRDFNIMILNFFSDLSVDQIAETVELAPKTIRNIISLSIKKVREEIGGVLDE